MSSSSSMLLPIPQDFLCPITQELLVDPVCTCDGQTYEREAIEEVFRRRERDPETGALRPPRSPMTNADLASVALTPNIALRKAIDSFMELRPDARIEEAHVKLRDVKAIVDSLEKDGSRKKAHPGWDELEQLRAENDQLRAKVETLTDLQRQAQLDRARLHSVEEILRNSRTTGGTTTSMTTGASRSDRDSSPRSSAAVQASQRESGADAGRQSSNQPPPQAFGSLAGNAGSEVLGNVSASAASRNTGNDSDGDAASLPRAATAATAAAMLQPAVNTSPPASPRSRSEGGGLVLPPWPHARPVVRGAGLPPYDDTTTSVTETLRARYSAMAPPPRDIFTALGGGNVGPFPTPRYAAAAYDHPGDVGLDGPFRQIPEVGRTTRQQRYAATPMNTGLHHERPLVTAEDLFAGDTLFARPVNTGFEVTAEMLMAGPRVMPPRRTSRHGTVSTRTPSPSVGIGPSFISTHQPAPSRRSRQSTVSLAGRTSRHSGAGIGATSTGTGARLSSNARASGSAGGAATWQLRGTTAESTTPATAGLPGGSSDADVDALFTNDRALLETKFMIEVGGRNIERQEDVEPDISLEQALGSPDYLVCLFARPTVEGSPGDGFIMIFRAAAEIPAYEYVHQLTPVDGILQWQLAPARPAAMLKDCDWVPYM